MVYIYRKIIYLFILIYKKIQLKLVITPDPSVPLPVLFGIICIFVIVLLNDEFKKDKNKS